MANVYHILQATNKIHAGHSLQTHGVITIPDYTRPAWLWTLAGAGAVSVIGVVINIATDLKTSVLAWLAVAVGTATGGVVTRAAQLATGGGRTHPGIAIAIAVGAILAITLGTLALISTPETGNNAPATPSSQTVASVSTSTTSVTRNPNQATTTARVVQSVTSYRLVSSSDFCPTSDKIDLDTGRSGHGGQTQLGDYVERCRVEGGLAELVLEQNELHTPKNSQLLYLSEPGEAAGRDKCRAVLREGGQLRSRIPLSQLHADSHICVKTDQGNIAEAIVLDVSHALEAELTIRFTTWS